MPVHKTVWSFESLSKLVSRPNKSTPLYTDVKNKKTGELGQKKFNWQITMHFKKCLFFSWYVLVSQENQMEWIWVIQSKKKKKKKKKEINKK